MRAPRLINRYGSYARVVAAPQRELLATRGLGPDAVSAIKLVQASALQIPCAPSARNRSVTSGERMANALSRGWP
jgi:DNA repair protein RadC